jgi:hypothetical protein
LLSLLCMCCDWKLPSDSKWRWGETRRDKQVSLISTFAAITCFFVVTSIRFFTVHSLYYDVVTKWNPVLIFRPLLGSISQRGPNYSTSYIGVHRDKQATHSQFTEHWQIICIIEVPVWISAHIRHNDTGSSSISSNFEITNELHGAEPFLRNRQLCGYSRPSQQFMEPEVHFCVHNSLPLDPIVSQVNPVHSTPSYLSMIHFNIAPPTYVLVFLVVSFLLTFPPISYVHSSSPPFVLHSLPISPSLTW